MTQVNDWFDFVSRDSLETMAPGFFEFLRDKCQEERFSIVCEKRESLNRNGTYYLFKIEELRVILHEDDSENGRFVALWDEGHEEDEKVYVLEVRLESIDIEPRKGLSIPMLIDECRSYFETLHYRILEQ